MNLDTARDILLWCLLINYGILLAWFLVFKFAHAWLYQLHGQWFRLSVEQFDSIHYVTMAIYKIAVLLFNLVPYLALWIAV
jgi:hypothetical protein